MKRALITFRQWSMWSVAITLLVLAVRFAAVAAAPFIDGMPSQDLAPLHEPSTSPTEPVAVEPPVVRGTPKPEPTGPVISVLLLARHSIERSKVFVNDAFVGHTVLMQNLACRRGETLTLKIVPDRGPAIEQKKLCAGETLSISDER
jgi:hypothetical protein